MAIGTWNPTGYGYGTAPVVGGYNPPTLSQQERLSKKTEDGSLGYGKPSLGHYLSGIGNIFGGISKYGAAMDQAEEVKYQGELALTEAFREASIIREEGRNFAASQSLQFIGSGVELVGSALITITQTIKYAETEAEAVETRGKAQIRSMYKQADVIESEGRAGLVGGIIKGITSFATVGV